MNFEIFEKVSFETFLKDCREYDTPNKNLSENNIKKIWKNIHMPELIHENVYKIFLPYSMCIQKEKRYLVLTGIKMNFDIIPFESKIRFKEETWFCINEKAHNIKRSEHLIIPIFANENKSLPVHYAFMTIYLPEKGDGSG